MNLTFGNPVGGTYVGKGVNGNLFNTNLAGQGIHEITYNYNDQNGCTNKINLNIEVENITSIDQVTNNEIYVYPNPFANIVNVKFQKEQFIKYELTDSQGKLIYIGEKNDKEFSLDFGSITPGFYYLKLTNGNTYNVYKLIKN